MRGGSASRREKASFTADGPPVSVALNGCGSPDGVTTTSTAMRPRFVLVKVQVTVSAAPSVMRAALPERELLLAPEAEAQDSPVRSHPARAVSSTRYEAPGSSQPLARGAVASA